MKRTKSLDLSDQSRRFEDSFPESPISVSQAQKVGGVPQQKRGETDPTLLIERVLVDPFDHRPVCQFLADHLDRRCLGHYSADRLGLRPRLRVFGRLFRRLDFCLP
jgi:hypothetical protein